MPDYQAVKESSGNIASVLPYGLAIFLSAFLLFRLEPINTRCILLLFGSGPAIWTTCMLCLHGFYRCMFVTFTSFIIFKKAAILLPSRWPFEGQKAFFFFHFLQTFNSKGLAP
jgi:hypothetical protein